MKDRVEEDEGALEKRAAFVISTPEVSPGLTLYDHMMREYLVRSNGKLIVLFSVKFSFLNNQSGLLGRRPIGVLEKWRNRCWGCRKEEFEVVSSSN